jgi:alkaline phosphatase D
VQVDRENVQAIEDPRRSLLGAAQEGWLEGELVESVRAKTRWQILGQQVIFAPQLPAGQPAGNPDAWDGYRVSRSRVFDMVERHQVPNLVVLTGDVHSSWAFDLPRGVSDAYDPRTGRASLGVEIVCPAVSSPTPFQGADGEARLAALPTQRPHLRFLDGRSRGYVVIDVTRDRLQADWWLLPTVRERSSEQRFAKGLVCDAGSRHLVDAASPIRASTTADPAPAPR